MEVKKKLEISEIPRRKEKNRDIADAFGLRRVSRLLQIPSLSESTQEPKAPISARGWGFCGFSHARAAARSSRRRRRSPRRRDRPPSRAPTVAGWAFACDRWFTGDNRRGDRRRLRRLLPHLPRVRLWAWWAPAPNWLPVFLSPYLFFLVSLCAKQRIVGPCNIGSVSTSAVSLDHGCCCRRWIVCLDRLLGPHSHFATLIIAKALILASWVLM